MALNTVSSDRLATNVKNTNFTAAEKQDLTDDILPLAGQLGNRNLIINGAMRVAQRGTSSTTSGYGSVDRWQGQHANTGVTVTHSQQTLSSSDTPYQSGFGKFFRLALSGAGTANANAYLEMQYRTESQDMLNSGWNYKSSSSFITMSFWFRCSTNQTFLARVFNHDSLRGYDFSFTASGNNAWTKITKTIPGNSNLVFNDDTGIGLRIHITPFYGTDYTNNLALDQWITGDPNNQFPDMASTWLTAGASTFDITGVQLEVGSVATDFEHRSFAQELALCQRYYYLHAAGTGMGGNSGETTISENATMYASNNMFCSIKFPTQMRAKPTLEVVTGSNYYISFSDGSSRGNFTGSGTALNSATSTNIAAINNSDTGSSSSGYTAIWRTSNAAAKIAFTAEL